MKHVLIILAFPFLNACQQCILSPESLKYMAGGITRSFDPTIDRGFTSPEELYRAHTIAGITHGGPKAYGMKPEYQRYVEWRKKNPNAERWEFYKYYDPVAQEWRKYRSKTEYLNRNDRFLYHN